LFNSVSPPHRDGIPNRSLGDFIAPKDTGLADYVGAFAVTTGLGSHVKIDEGGLQQPFPALRSAAPARHPACIMGDMTHVAAKKNG
jgi:hypothetical protein